MSQDNPQRFTNSGWKNARDATNMALKFKACSDDDLSVFSGAVPRTGRSFLEQNDVCLVFTVSGFLDDQHLYIQSTLE